MNNPLSGVSAIVDTNGDLLPNPVQGLRSRDLMTEGASYKEKVFRKAFNRDEFQKFRAAYESINPDRPNETSNFKYEDTDQKFRKFLEGAARHKNAFVNEFLPHLGLFLQGPFPLPGSRVTNSAWDCRGKFGAYEAAGILPKLVGSRVLDIGCNAGYGDVPNSVAGLSRWS
jgi:hypothetical protein